MKKRYGHPFKKKKLLEKKLENWPKISTKDTSSLTKYGDFLNECLDALPHVPGLTVLNDFKENQRMVSKLPEWLITR